ncbi:unnamed protein product [Orchesella dallaii]|uniref:HRDC domain-containing protein n=1 Tax=Orchesella dallaii TaxID=48710 RepID=A0ABP1QPR8_9HEXA
MNSELEPMPSDEYIKMLTDFGSSMQSKLQQLGISMNPEDGKFFAMLYEWRKRVGEMRMIDDLETVLPTKIMATLASSKPATETDLMKILDQHQCLNDHNKYQTAAILKLLNDGTFFEKMVKCMCNNCGIYGHVAKFCLRPQNAKAANKLYRKCFPEKRRVENRRRKSNNKRNKRLRKGLLI